MSKKPKFDPIKELARQVQDAKRLIDDMERQGKKSQNVRPLPIGVTRNLPPDEPKK